MSKVLDIYSEYLPEAHILVCIALQLAVTEIQHVQEFTEWPQTGLEHLAVKSIPHTLKTYPWGSNFDPFHSTTSSFQDIAHFIIAHWLPMYHVKCEKEQKKNLQKIRNLKFHNTTLPMSMHEFVGANLLCSFRQDVVWSFFSDMVRPMLMKTKKNWQKCKIWNFVNLYTTLVEPIPRSMHGLLGVNLWCTFRGDVVWSFFLPYGAMLTKIKKKWQKFEISLIVLMQLW